MIIILFGLAGAGKTYVGNLISRHYNFHYQEADDWITDEMKLCIKEKKLFTLYMLEEFVGIMISRLKNLRTKYKNIVISQALYLEDNRNEILKHFAKKEVCFFQVHAENSVIKTRLTDRNNYVDYEYAASMVQYFEPIRNGVIIENNLDGDKVILEQLNIAIKT